MNKKTLLSPKRKRYRVNSRYFAYWGCAIKYLGKCIDEQLAKQLI